MSAFGTCTPILVNDSAGACGRLNLDGTITVDWDRLAALRDAGFDRRYEWVIDMFFAMRGHAREVDEATSYRIAAQGDSA